MAFGAEFVKAIAKYLRRFEGRKLQSVAGVSSFCVLMFGKNSNLLLSFDNSNAGVSLITDEEKKFLLTQNDFLPPITNAIKSHLIGATCISFEQINNDKVLAINFERQIGANFKTKLSLILELQPRHSNLLLVTEEGKIIEAARHFTPEQNTVRTILPRLCYTAPPSLDGEALSEWLEAPTLETLSDISGFGRPFLKFLANFGLPVARDVMRQFDASDFVALSLENYTAPFPLSCLDKLPDDIVTCNIEIALHGTFDNFVRCTLEAKRKKVLKAIDREASRREKQLNDIKNLLAETKSERYKLWADLITANIWCIEKHAANEVALTQYNEDGSTSEVLVPLDVTSAPSKMAGAYYKKYKKLRASKERAKELLGVVEAEKSDFETQHAIAEATTSFHELDILVKELGIEHKLRNSKPTKRDDKEASMPYKKIVYDDAIIFLGLSAKGNRFVTFKLATPSDTWFHAQGVPGSHVLLRIVSFVTPERFEELQNECATLAASYSKAKGEAGTRVDYCLRKFVTAIQGGVANVTYKNFSSIYTVLH